MDKLDWAIIIILVVVSCLSIRGKYGLQSV